MIEAKKIVEAMEDLGDLKVKVGEMVQIQKVVDALGALYRRTVEGSVKDNMLAFEAEGIWKAIAVVAAMTGEDIDHGD